MNAKHQWKYTSEENIDEISPVDITFEVPGEVTLTQMLYNFEYYLKACGFIFDGSIEIVPNDVCADTIDDTDYCCMGDSDSCTDNEWTKADKNLKEWKEGIAKLSNEQLQKAMKTAYEMSGLHYEATKEVEKNNWVHGMCNPPSPDYKKDIESCKTTGKKYTSVKDMLDDINNPDNCWNS
jgi:hypothetical protein